MKIKLKIKRFDPAKDARPYYRSYTLEIEPMARVLDAIMQVKRFQDSSLGFRKSCAHGVCGSDAMRINAKDRLACKTLVRDVAAKAGDVITIEPLRYLPVQRDLIVDQTAFFARYRAVKPYLINDEPAPEKERRQSQKEHRAFDDTTNCILCASCFSACPVPEDQPGFLGPAAIVGANRFITDSRDRGFEQRLPHLDTPDGVWLCQNHFKCTRACPREIKITKRINQTKRMITEHRKSRGESVNDGE